MQIKNLSAAQVQPFGEILSAESELLPPCAERWQIRPGADVRELRADGPVVLDYVSGMPLLVIYEKDARSVYYLDRVLALRPGVRFSIAALGSGCEVDCRARQPGLVQLLACHPAEEFSGTGSELKLERLYTFFYQECASWLKVGILFLLSRIVAALQHHVFYPEISKIFRWDQKKAHFSAKVRRRLR